MNTPLILVGTGEYYRKILKPALRRLVAKEFAYPLLTVDIRERESEGDVFFDSIPHRMRHPEEKLSDILKDLAPLSPVVILGHANHLHVSDAEDLVEAGFRILVEKPFALSMTELSRLRSLVEQNPGKVGLIEYYLTMKTAPLFALTQQLDVASFFSTEKLLESQPSSQRDLERVLLGETLSKCLGKVKSVVIEVLEGEGDTGRFDHRGIHLIGKKFGGGVIHDLGIHAFAPLVSLRNWIGDFNPATIGVKTAHCRQYLTMAKETFNLEPDEVAESYAEITLATSQDVPVTIRIGKYVLDNTNRRGLKVIGEYGEVTLDWSDPRVSMRIGDTTLESIFALPKTEEKYYSVLRSSLLELEGSSPHTFSISDVSLRAGELTLETVAVNQEIGVKYEYDAGAYPEDIF